METDSSWNMSVTGIPGEKPIERRKKNKKRKRSEPEKVVEEVNEGIEVDPLELETEIIDIKQENSVINDFWPCDKLLILLQKMKSVIPENDTLKYSSRVTKIDWDKLSFDNYSGSDCEKMWKRIQEKSRCYRLLEEIISDAEGALQKPSSGLIQRLQMQKRHPDRPSKPLSSFMLFFMDKKRRILRKNRGASGAEVAKQVAELWKTINPMKLEKYKIKAQKLKEEYHEKLAKFYEEHPECIEEIKKKENLNLLGFVKPKSAFQLYRSSCLDSKKVNDKSFDEKQFYEDCRTNWKNMPEKDKVSWIKAAQEEEEQYITNLKKYESEHPGFVLPTVKTLITKNDRHVLENFKGKPKKPPSNAYSLYSAKMLQRGSLKSIPPKERMAEIAKRWKSLSVEKKEKYTYKLQKIQEEYNEKYNDYVNSLSPDERLQEEAKNTPKKKMNQVVKSDRPVPEPQKPPIDAIELLRTKKEHTWKRKPKEDPVVFARKKWEKLSEDQKKTYVRELKEINEEYIENFGKFLQQCSPDRITEYLNAILQHKKKFLGTLKMYADYDVSEDENNSNNDSGS